MRSIILLLIKQLAAVSSFGYVVAPQPQAPTPHPEKANPTNSLPTLIELPQLGEELEDETLVRVRPRGSFEPCSPCPAPATPTICPAVECPELICDVVKTDVKTNQAVDMDLAEEEVQLRARFARRNKRDVGSIVDVNQKCNSNYLKLIMKESMSSNIVVSKVTIAERASNEIGEYFDVICTTGLFSYYVAAEQFCEVTKNNTTCFTYRRDDTSRAGLTLKSADYQQKEDEALFGRTSTGRSLRDFDQDDFDSGKVIVI